MVSLLAMLVLGDVQFSNQGVDAGIVTRLNCGPGLKCTRSGSVGIITLDGGAATDGGYWAQYIFESPLYNDGGTGIQHVGVFKIPLSAVSPIALYDDGGTVGVLCTNCVTDAGGVVASHGWTPLALESGAAAFDGGVCGITFVQAFVAAPKCVCSDATAVFACSVQAATTTAATFYGTVTDAFNYQCAGVR